MVITLEWEEYPACMAGKECNYHPESFSVFVPKRETEILGWMYIAFWEYEKQVTSEVTKARIEIRKVSKVDARQFYSFLDLIGKNNIHRELLGVLC